MENLYKSFPDALDALAKFIRSRRFDPHEYYIVLTPDRYTLAVETALFKGGGAIDCEVLTLSRLCRRVLGAGNVLSAEAGVMLTARAISAVKHNFGYYGHAAKFGDFAREVYETLLQIESSGTSAGDITAEGSTAEKLHDLAMIKEEYDRLKAGYSDSPDRLKDLIAAVKDSALVRQSHIFAIGYKDATKLNRNVFDALRRSAKSFVLLDAEPPAPRKSLTVYRAPDSITQYKKVAALIRDYVYKGNGAGARYGDVSVICPEPRALSRILREYGIEFYSDITTALFDTPPLCCIYDVYRYRGGDARTLVAIAKNPFSGCNREDAEMFELSASRYIDLDGASADAEAGVRNVAVRLKNMTDVFKSADSFADACEKLAEYCGFESTAELFGNETDVISPISRLIELLRKYGGNTEETFDADASAFFSAARALPIKSLPRSVDRVNVTDPRALRLTRCKKLFVVDFNEGVLPRVTADGGLLSDAELNATGGVIDPTAREMNRRDREELLAVISNAEDVFCAYSTADGGRRSAFISDCVEDADGGLTELDHAEELFALKNSTDAGFISAFACVPSAAREISARGLSAYSESISAAVGGCSNVSPPFVDSIDVARTKLSVSELTHWFGCPYKRFLSDSIGLKERRTGVTSADFGIIIHEFMRRWIVETPLDASRENVEKKVNAILDEAGLYMSGRDAVDRERIVRDACDYAEINKRVIEAGKYVPDKDYIEHYFDGELTLGKANVPFVGVIDRVDVCGDRARIIDYKTGSRKFDIKKCLDGSDMQLPLYAAVLKDRRVTGMFYMPLRPVYDDGVKLVGCMIKDPDIAIEYDGSLADGGKSDVVAAQLKTDGNGEATGFVRPTERIMEEVDFDGLMRTAVATASLAADEINSGYIEKAPACGECERCAYGGLCYDRKTRGAAAEEEDE